MSVHAELSGIIRHDKVNACLICHFCHQANACTANDDRFLACDFGVKIGYDLLSCKLFYHLLRSL